MTTEKSLNFLEILTWVVHVTTLGFTFFVVYIALANEIVLFTWHPILLTIGVSSNLLQVNTRQIAKMPLLEILVLNLTIKWTCQS